MVEPQGPGPARAKQAVGSVSKEVRVRYAPSPTGQQHIGGIRTALFNYLYARQQGGRLILRIEDTDRARSTPAFEQDLMQQLGWLGLAWDEGPDIGGSCGPYRQSERGALYREALQRLLAQGAAYPCYCSPEELAEERRQARAQGRPPRYSGHCREPERRAARRLPGRSPLYRLRVPEGRDLVFDDLIRRRVGMRSDDLGDFAIYTAQDETLQGGRALYNLAVVVDDHAMAITHVLRGEEHLPNTPRQLLLYEALGYAPPRFGHLSLILTPQGDKMSKRAKDISIAQLAEQGYLPEAILAYVATLGWASGAHPERLALADLSRRFDLERLSANPSVFDPERLRWFNKRWLRQADQRTLIEQLRPRLVAVYGRWEAAEDTAHDAEEWLSLLVGAAQEEAATLSEIVALAAFALAAERPDLTGEAQEALAVPIAAQVLSHAAERLDAEALATPELANARLRELRHHWRDAAGLRGRLVMFPLRAALTGSLTGPCLGIVTSLLGSDRCRQRIAEAVEWLTTT
jgi:nondiscriminating glutamyl-tRNA synthetase